MKYKNVPIHDITITKHPIIYLELLAMCIVDLIVWLKNFLIRRFFIISFLLILGVIIVKVEALHVNLFLSPLVFANVHCFHAILDYFGSGFIDWSWHRSSYICPVFGASYCKSSYGCHKLRTSA